MFEGSVPSQAVPSEAEFLDVSGGEGGGLRGTLPPKVGRIKECLCLALQRQHLEGVIPYIQACDGRVSHKTRNPRKIK